MSVLEQAMAKRSELDLDRFLPAAFDDAYMGEAVRSDHAWTPVYDMGWLIRDHGWSVIGYLLGLSDETKPLVLQKPAREDLWRRVKSGELMAWEIMNGAALGVLGWGAGSAHAILYDLESVLVTLFKSQAFSEILTADQRFHQAKTFFDTRMAPLDCGDSTPWYLFKQKPNNAK